MLAQSLLLNRTLLHLDISENAVHSLQPIAAVLADNTPLQTLQASWVMGDPGNAGYVAAALRCNTHLTFLGASMWGFGDTGAALLADAIERNTGVVHVDLSHNDISLPQTLRLRQIANRRQVCGERGREGEGEIK